MDFAALFTTAGLISLFTLTVMEVVLGIDNIVFLSIITGRLPIEEQKKARNLGLILALIPRILLLLFLSWIISWKDPLFTIPGIEIHAGKPLGLTGKGLVLLLGGLFLIYKSTSEIHHKLEGEDEMEAKPKRNSFSAAILQIVLINIIFSFDSIMTAVGLADEVIIMIVAVIISVFIMMAFAGVVSRFVNRHPTIKMLALSFLLMIGVMLVVESVEYHVPKGYIYVSMAFSVGVEMLNIRMRKKSKSIPVKLHDQYEIDDLSDRAPNNPKKR